MNQPFCEQLRQIASRSGFEGRNRGNREKMTEWEAVKTESATCRSGLSTIGTRGMLGQSKFNRKVLIFPLSKMYNYRHGASLGMEP